MIGPAPAADYTVALEQRIERLRAVINAGVKGTHPQYRRAYAALQPGDLGDDQ